MSTLKTHQHSSLHNTSPFLFLFQNHFFFPKEHLCFLIYSENGLHKAIALFNRLYIMIIKGLELWSSNEFSLNQVPVTHIIVISEELFNSFVFQFSHLWREKNNNYVNNQGSLVLSTTFAEAEESIVANLLQYLYLHRCHCMYICIYNNLMMLSRVVRMGTLQRFTL